MSRRCFSKRTIYDIPIERFHSAEEAWLWFNRCEKVRQDGARLDGLAEVGRPCDSDDIYRAVMGLVRARRISRWHLRVLAEFGRREVAPDPRLPEENVAARLWDEALDRLSTVLKRKGILA